LSEENLPKISTGMESNQAEPSSFSENVADDSGLPQLPTDIIEGMDTDTQPEQTSEQQPAQPNATGEVPQPDAGQQGQPAPQQQPTPGAEGQQPQTPAQAVAEATEPSTKLEEERPGVQAHSDQSATSETANLEIIDQYQLKLHKIQIDIKITMKESDFVPNYIISITNISTTTKIILEKIREEFISKVETDNLDLSDVSQKDLIKERFKSEIAVLLDKYFPGATTDKKDMLISYLIEQNLGLGHIEILLNDPNLEEIVVNNAKEPVWVYHKKEGWLKTNIVLLKENKIRHYSTMIGRDVNKEITLLHPLLDAHLLTGDRVNATLTPISTKGNTITIRKFSKDPWTITKFLKAGTINYYSAAMIWQLIQNELSVIVVGGTGSGKTSMLNVLANFYPPNHRVISIEDTRELTLPDNIHWVPMETRLPNPEGKGGVSMLDLVVNSLRMRPDRIAVGEIRRKEEAEVLMEAMHTGHSVYGTFHANTAEEAVIRLTNEPIKLSKPTLSSLGAFLVQNRDRRTGKRRVLQIAEITPEGDPHIVVQYDARQDTQVKKENQERLYNTLNIYTGMTPEEIEQDIQNKMAILKWLVKNDISDINQIGIIMAKYYRGKLFN
jgi:flagellar protein FlaI